MRIWREKTSTCTCGSMMGTLISLMLLIKKHSHSNWRAYNATHKMVYKHIFNLKNKWNNCCYGKSFACQLHIWQMPDIALLLMKTKRKFFFSNATVRTVVEANERRVTYSKSHKIRKMAPFCKREKMLKARLVHFLVVKTVGLLKKNLVFRKFA